MNALITRARKNMKKQDKGFTLVELIIVIAIVAVLVGVLAPQFIKYVERSRQSADITAADAIATALKTTAVDPGYMDAFNSCATVTATWTGSNGELAITSKLANGNAGPVTDIAGGGQAILEILGATGATSPTMKVKSKALTNGEITIVYTPGTGKINASCNSTTDDSFNTMVSGISG